jgi:predicted PurR-regulated permease PerM
MSEGVLSPTVLARITLVALVAIATLAFVWLIAPFSGAILWAVIAAVLFEPLNARVLSAMPRRRGSAAFATLLVIVIVIVVVVPAMLLAAALLREATAFYARIRTGDIDLGRLFVETQGHLPGWARSWLADIGLGDMGGLRTKLGQGFASSFQSVAGQVLNIGQGTFAVFLALGVMLYLTFFLLRDGHELAARIERAIPLTPDQRAVLIAKFVAVIRATIKGSVIVAILQGATGGLVFWAMGIPGALLWGVAMGVFSLFPAIGTGLIWVPVTFYLLATGVLGRGVPVTYLSHAASFHSTERITPSNSGIKHLAAIQAGLHARSIDGYFEQRTVLGARVEADQRGCCEQPVEVLAAECDVRDLAGRQWHHKVEFAVGIEATDAAPAPMRDPQMAFAVDRHAVGIALSLLEADEGLSLAEPVGVAREAVDRPLRGIRVIEPGPVGRERGPVRYAVSRIHPFPDEAGAEPVQRTAIGLLRHVHRAAPDMAGRIRLAVVHAATRQVRLRIGDEVDRERIERQFGKAAL